MQTLIWINEGARPRITLVVPIAPSPEVPKDDGSAMTKGLEERDIKVVGEGSDLFVEVDGIRVARRGDRGSPQEGTWISLEPGWEVFDGENFESVTVRYTQPRLQ